MALQEDLLGIWYMDVPCFWDTTMMASVAISVFWYYFLFIIIIIIII